MVQKLPDDQWPVVIPPTSREIQFGAAAEYDDLSESLMRSTVDAFYGSGITIQCLTETPEIRQVFCTGIDIGLRIAEARRLKKEREGTFLPNSRKKP